MYSSYCDCGKFVNWIDEPTTGSSDNVSDIEKQVVELAVTDVAGPSSSKSDPMQIDTEEEKEESNASYAWFISRGAEMCDVSDGVCK